MSTGEFAVHKKKVTSQRFYVRVLWILKLEPVGLSQQFELFVAGDCMCSFLFDVSVSNFYGAGEFCTIVILVSWLRSWIGVS